MSIIKTIIITILSIVIAALLANRNGRQTLKKQSAYCDMIQLAYTILNFTMRENKFYADNIRAYNLVHNKSVNVTAVSHIFKNNNIQNNS